MKNNTTATMFHRIGHGPVRRTLAVALLVLALSPAIGGAASFIYETASEMQSDGDFDGDGRRDLIIVDKLTGDYRIGYQLSAGTYTWTAARASGIAGATGLGIGKINTLTYDSIALTGADANRVNLLDANNTAVAGLPFNVYIPSLGPNSVAAIDIGGGGNTAHDDLYVASIYNGVSPYRQTLLRDDGSTNHPALGDSAITYLRERVNAVLLHTNRPPRLGYFERNVSATVDYFSISDLSSGSAVNVATVATSRTPNPYEFVTGPFNITIPYEQFLFYPPGGWYFFDYQVTEPVPGTYNLVYTNTFTLSNFIASIFVLPGTNGTKLLVLDTNQVTAEVYSFNGLTAPVPVQVFTAPAGEHFTGAGVLGNSGFTAYSAPAGQKTSSNFRQFSWNGTGYTQVAAGSLPRISSYSASGNVMQFAAEPFVNINPLLLRLNSAGDWTSGLGFSGSPRTVSVRTETFLNSTQGLVNPTPAAVGLAHPLANFGLANQYSNQISLFSFNAPAGDKISDVTISPPGGIYPVSVTLQFSSANSTDIIYFRIGNGSWITWSTGMYVPIFTNATVQYYGQPSSGVGKSAIKTASYFFTEGPATRDSKGDGIPDYVKIALGLTLTGSRDTDGDGYSDLEELIHGTDPLSVASVPTNFPHLDDQAAFDLNVTSRPWDGFANLSTLSATGAIVRAFDLQGTLSTSSTADSNHWPVARLTNIVIIPENRLTTFATDPHFAVITSNSDTNIGRELIGLAAVPPAPFPPIPYVYGGGNLAVEASNWVASASNILNHLPRVTLTRNLAPENTLESALFELKLAQLLGARSNLWSTNITLFPFRVPDVSRTNPPQLLLLDLENTFPTSPGYKLQTIYGTISNLVQNSSAPSIVSLRAVVHDIYRIDSLLNNTNPAQFALPLDEIRFFLNNNTFDSHYLPWATTVGQFPAAAGGAATILASVSSRPVTNVSLVVRSDTEMGPCRVLDIYGGGGSFALQEPSGLPFTFPNNFDLLPGTIVQVTGYTDVPNVNCAYPAIEVTSILLTSVPIATDIDGNGNLLVDTWEQRFFGAVGITDPFGDADGDGYQNLQEMLEGTDPRDFFGRPLVPAVVFGAPVLNLQGAGTLGELHFNWPAGYIGRFRFGVRHTADLSVPFVDLPVSAPTFVSGNEFEISFTIPPTTAHFYYLVVSLQ